MPTISISLPAQMLAEFEAAAQIESRRSGTRVTLQDVVRSYIRMGITYEKLLNAQEQQRGDESNE